MSLKRIISGLTAGVIAASIGVSAVAAAPTVKWSNGISLETTKNNSATSTGTLSETITSAETANATIVVDLLLKGASDDNGASYLALKSDETKVLSIERSGWSSKSYTVDGNDVIFFDDSSNKDTHSYAHHFVITLDFVNDMYTVEGTKKDNNKVETVTGKFTADSVDSLVIYAGKSGGAGNVAKIEKLSITTQDIKSANAYDYKNDSELAHPDAKGFTSTFTVKEGSSVNSLTWYLKKGTGDWKELTSRTLPVTTGTIKVGLIVYDLPEGVKAEDISAGYTYTQTIQ